MRPAEVPPDPSPLHRLPDELLLQIGEHLLALPESSSLKAAVLTSKRLRDVWSPFLDRSIQKFAHERGQFARQLCTALLADDEAPLRQQHRYVASYPPKCRSYLLHDAIDHIASSRCDDHKKSVALTALLKDLNNLASGSELLPIATRLVECHNRLSVQEQGPSLVAIAQLTKKFPAEACEPWIAGLTHALATQGQTFSPEVRQVVICELADLTGRVSDDKKALHIVNVLMLIGGLPGDRRQTCYRRLDPYKEHITVSGLGGTAMKQLGQQLTNKLLSYFGSGNQG